MFRSLKGVLTIVFVFLSHVYTQLVRMCLALWSEMVYFSPLVNCPGLWSVITGDTLHNVPLRGVFTCFSTFINMFI